MNIIWRIVIDTGVNKFLYMVGSAKQIGPHLKRLNENFSALGWSVYAIGERF